MLTHVDRTASAILIWACMSSFIGSNGILRYTTRFVQTPVKTNRKATEHDYTSCTSIERIGTQTYIQTNKQRKKESQKERNKEPATHTHLNNLEHVFFFSGALHERLCSMLSGQCRRGNTFIILKCGLLVSLYSNISYIPHHHLLGIKIWIRFDLRVSLPNTKAVPNTHRISSGVLLFISPPGHTTPQSPHCACGANEETCYPST